MSGSSLGRIVAVYKWSNAIYFIGAMGCIHCAFRRGVQPAPGSVAGLGVRGPLGPRIGSSSGISPGSSLGCGGWPGSRKGGGTSGRGLPGGLSGGGSVGCPGVAGGISGGSIGIPSPEGRPQAQ